MNYEIEVSESERFLRLKAQGDVSVELARKWSLELKEMAHPLGITCFLFDMRIAKNVSSIIDNYYFAYRDADRLGLARNVRSAILANRADNSHNFVETTMQNANFNVRLFNEESTAISWLEEYTH